MFELILWGIFRICEEIKDSFNRSGEIYEEIGGEFAGAVRDLLGSSDIQQTVIAPNEDFPCMN